MELLHPFEEHLYQAATDDILTWGVEERADTYAILLLHTSVCSADSSEREIVFEAVISINHNTETHRQSQDSQGPSEDAKWNEAYWLTEQTDLVPRLPEYGQDPDIAERAKWDDWCVSVGLVSDSTDASGRPLYPGVCNAVILACQRVGQRLHESGFLTQAFGRPIPVLISGEGSEAACVAATRAANPAGLSEGYEEFVLGRTYAQITAQDGLLHEIKKLPKATQASLWIEAILALAFESSSSLADQLAAIYPDLPRYNMLPTGLLEEAFTALAEVGVEAVPVTLPVIEKYALMEQTNAHGIEANKQDGPTTRASRLTTGLLGVLDKIGVANEEEVSCLYSLMPRLFRDSADKKWGGWNVLHLAHTLHVLRPDRFPEKKRSGRTNHLLNWQEYGLTEADDL